MICNRAWVMLVACATALSGGAIRPERFDGIAEDTQKEATGSEADWSVVHESVAAPVPTYHLIRESCASFRCPSGQVYKTESLEGRGKEWCPGACTAEQCCLRVACMWPMELSGSTCFLPRTPPELLGRWVDVKGSFYGGSVIAIETDGWRPVGAAELSPLGKNTDGRVELRENTVEKGPVYTHHSQKHVGFVTRVGDELQISGSDGSSFSLSQAQCDDLVGWSDVDGFTCDNYVKKSWCFSGETHREWHKTWGTLADWAKPGFPGAGTACCACGRKAGDAVPATSNLQALFKYPGKTGLNCEGNQLFKLQHSAAKSDSFLDECGQKCLDHAECNFLAFLATKECMGCKSTPKYSKELTKTKPNPWRALMVPSRTAGFSHLHDPCWDHCEKEAGTHDQCNWCGKVQTGLSSQGMYCCSHNKAVVGSYLGNHPCNYAITERLPEWTVHTDYRCMARRSSGTEVVASSVGGDEGVSEGGAGSLRPLGISAALITACLFSAFNLD